MIFIKKVGVLMTEKQERALKTRLSTWMECKQLLKTGRRKGKKTVLKMRMIQAGAIAKKNSPSDEKQPPISTKIIRLGGTI